MTLRPSSRLLVALGCSFKQTLLRKFSRRVELSRWYHALERAAKGHFTNTPVLRLDSPAAIKTLLADLRKEQRRTLLVTTEDNGAVAVLDALLHASIDVPERVGLLSTMGSRIVSDRSITAAGFDFRLMGAEAARMAICGTLQHIQLPAAFFPSKTA
jgi:DNA-binding LacI/PurR family transcriptional regulator